MYIDYRAASLPMLRDASPFRKLPLLSTLLCHPKSPLATLLKVPVDHGRGMAAATTAADVCRQHWRTSVASVADTGDGNSSRSRILATCVIYRYRQWRIANAATDATVHHTVGDRLSLSSSALTTKSAILHLECGGNRKPRWRQSSNRDQ